MKKRLASLAVGSLLAVSGVLTAQPALAVPVDTEEDVYQELTWVVQDVGDYWSTVLYNDYGYAWQTVNYDIFSGSTTFSTPCGNATSDPDNNDGSPAFYCTIDNTIYLSSEWIYENIASGGDFGPAVVVAHEMGHALQQQLGIVDPPDSLNVQPTELQADCFAGQWAHEKENTGQLESGDISEGTEALRFVGDYNFDSQTHHGTPAQRENAFEAGYYGYYGYEIDSCPLNVGA